MILMPMRLEVIVQEVATRWTKSSRGGEGAALRNRCPVAFPVPSGATWHRIEMNESRDFEPVQEFAGEIPQPVHEGLSLRIRHGRLSVLPQVSAFWMPKRHRRPPRHSIGPGEWLRWSVNYRLGLDDGWMYGLVSWNVAFWVSPMDGTLFLGDPPQKVDELASLR
jgi:hypothetical protein